MPKKKIKTSGAGKKSSSAAKPKQQAKTKKAEKAKKPKKAATAAEIAWWESARAALEEVESQPFAMESHGGSRSRVLAILQPDHADRSKRKREQKKRAAKRRKIDPGSESELEPLAQTKLERLLEGTPEQVRERRSFSKDRPRQVLRWTATCLLTLFPAGVEVQCYFANNTVYISSNETAINKELANLLNAHGNNVVDAISNSYEKLAAKGPRPKRHATKLIQRAEDGGYEGQDPILKCLREGKIEVIDGKGSEKGFHAERRIQARLKIKLNPKFLAGVKRPCAICANALELLGKCYPGPAWVSAAAARKVTAEEFVQALADHVEECGNPVEQVLTYVTKTRAGKLTTGHDTESDSDDSGSVAENDDSDEEEESDGDDELFRKEIRAKKLLHQNNCLINAIALAAGRKKATEDELVEIRSKLNNVGEMMLATHETVDVIRAALGLNHHVVVYNDDEGQYVPEEFEGDGPEINIHNTGHLHFKPGLPPGLDE